MVMHIVPRETTVVVSWGFVLPVQEPGPPSVETTDITDGYGFEFFGQQSWVLPVCGHLI